MRPKYIFLAFIMVGLCSCAQNTKTIQELSNKNPEYYYNLGMAGLSSQNYAKAIANFKKAILKDQNYYKAYDKLAISYINVGDYKKAIENIDKAINIKPDYYQGILDKALILEQKNKNKAIETLYTCINNDFCDLKPEAYYQLANIYKSNPKNYIKNLELAILYNRNFQRAKYDLATAYTKNNMCQNKNIEKKVEYLLQDSKHPKYELIKAKCYIENKDYKKASKIINKLLSNDNLEQKYKQKAIKFLKVIILNQVNSSSHPIPK